MSSNSESFGYVNNLSQNGESSVLRSDTGILSGIKDGLIRLMYPGDEGYTPTLINDQSSHFFEASFFYKYLRTANDQGWPLEITSVRVDHTIFEDSMVNQEFNILVRRERYVGKMPDTIATKYYVGQIAVGSSPYIGTVMKLPTIVDPFQHHEYVDLQDCHELQDTLGEVENTISHVNTAQRTE